MSTEYLIKTSPVNYEEKILLSEKNKVENAGVNSQNKIIYQPLPEDQLYQIIYREVVTQWYKGIRILLK